MTFVLIRQRFIPLLLCCAWAAPLHAAPDPFGVETGVAAPCPQPGAPVILGDAPLELADVIDLALCHNPQTRAAWASAKVEANLVGVAEAAYLPNIDASLGVSRRYNRSDDGREWSRQRTGNLSLSYLLFDFGGRAARLENSRQLLNAAISNQDVTRQTVFLEALQAFYQVHATAAATEAAQAAETAAQQSFKAAEARHQAGVATPADRLQAQTAYSQSTLNRIRIQGSFKNAQGTLANVIGLDAQRPVTLAPLASPLVSSGSGVPPQFEANLEQAIAAARLRRPDLAAALARYKAAEAAIDSARSDGLPRLNLSAGPSYTATHLGDERSSNRSGSLNLTLSIPLFSGFANSYQIRAAQARLEESDAAREKLALQVSLEVWRTWQDLRTASQSLSSAADLLASAEASARVTLGRYQAGVGNILDVLNAQSALADARMQQIQAAYDWHIARAALARALGVLDKNLLDEDFAFTALPNPLTPANTATPPSRNAP
ncbi:MAG: TolC family protein [Zoogloeaceae bacterium]|jgi:TolC family type I secretion outer membrane protein|nr:TolC family protein [Zoogloeaceae bacterium]